MRVTAVVLLAAAFATVFMNIQPYMKYENFWVYVWDPGLLGLTAWRIWLFINVILTILMSSFTSLIVESTIPPLLWLLNPEFFIYLALTEAVVETFTAAIRFFPIPLAYIIAAFPPEQWLLFWPSIRWIVLSYAATSCVWSIYFLLFQVLAISAIITGVLFLLRVKTKYLFSSFISIQSSFGLAALTGHVNMGTPLTSIFLTPNVIFQQLLFGGASGALARFLMSPLFFSALACYLYIEAGLLLVYISEIISQASERGEKVERQLRVVEELAAASSMIELRERVTLSKEASILLERLAEMKIFSKPEAARVEALHDMRILKAYVEDVFLRVPDARLTLSTKDAAPKVTSLIRSSLTGMLLRVCGVIALSFICFTALFVLRQVGAPLLVVESLEVAQPEIVLVLLLPIVFSFSMAATIIRTLTRGSKRREGSGEEGSSG
ncbi:MAG: hypothetical protein KIH01_03720 [Candidatus Freyarchaeota archaeon]|nr:hypothetical protein [Candidatus Jordarchaeia archaeon]